MRIVEKVMLWVLWLALCAVIGWNLGTLSRSSIGAEKSTGDTGYYSSPHVTRPANIGGYTECPLVFKKKDGTYYAKVTVCHRA